MFAQVNIWPSVSYLRPLWDRKKFIITAALTKFSLAFSRNTLYILKNWWASLLELFSCTYIGSKNGNWWCTNFFCFLFSHFSLAISVFVLKVTEELANAFMISSPGVPSFFMFSISSLVNFWAVELSSNCLLCEWVSVFVTCCRDCGLLPTVQFVRLALVLVWVWRNKTLGTQKSFQTVHWLTVLTMHGEYAEKAVRH